MYASFLELRFNWTVTYWMMESSLICAGIICNFNLSPRLYSTLFSRGRRPPAVLPNTSTYTAFRSKIIRSLT